MADDDEGRAQALQLALQPFDRRQVEVIGRLVEQQDVGLRRQHTGKRGAAGLAAGQRGRVLLAGEAELVEQAERAILIVERAEPVLDIGERRREAGQVRLLRQVADAGVRLQEAHAGIGLDLAGGDLEQRRLAGAVAADEAGSLAALDGEVGSREQGRAAAEREGDVLERQERGVPCG